MRGGLECEGGAWPWGGARIMGGAQSEGGVWKEARKKALRRLGRGGGRGLLKFGAGFIHQRCSGRG